MSLMIVDPYRFVSQTPWTPDQLSPQFWYDDTGLNSTGSNFDTWDNNVAADTLGYVNLRPTITTLNSLPAIIGPRISYASTGGLNTLFNNTSASYAFVVFKKPVLTASGAFECLFSFLGSTGFDTRVIVLVSTTTDNDQLVLWTQRINGEGITVTDPNYALDTAWHMALFEMDWANGVAYMTVDDDSRNSQAMLSSGTTGNDAVGDYTSNINANAINAGGQSDTSDCHIAGMVFGNTQILSTEERNKLFGWAAHKWGLTGNLPLSHPYKSNPPKV